MKKTSSRRSSVVGRQPVRTDVKTRTQDGGRRTGDVYLDNAATTPVDSRVVKAMLPFMTDVYANPSSLHSLGQRAGVAVRQARESIAAVLNGHADEIVFTSGGTESDNLAIIGTVVAASAYMKAKFGPEAKAHAVTTAIEHHAILEPLLYLQKVGEIDLTVVAPQKNGVVRASDVLDAINERTFLVSVMYANNEIGTVQPLADIGRGILKIRKNYLQENSRSAQSQSQPEGRDMRDAGPVRLRSAPLRAGYATTYPLLHSDACQAAGYLDLDVEKLHVDLLTLNGGKIYGPKGVGLLFVRRGIKLAPLLLGGGQERGMRSGTENVPGIVGLSVALEMAQTEKDKESKRLCALRDRLIAGLLKILKSRLNGDAEKRLPNNVNISFLDIEGEAAMLYLDAKGIYCSTGSACASTALEPSHVIRALGLSYEAAHGSLRFSLGRHTTKADVDSVIKVMPAIVERLRKISPVNLDMSYFD